MFKSIKYAKQLHFWKTKPTRVGDSLIENEPSITTYDWIKDNMFKYISEEDGILFIDDILKKEDKK